MESKTAAEAVYIAELKGIGFERLHLKATASHKYFLGGIQMKTYYKVTSRFYDSGKTSADISTIKADEIPEWLH